MTPHLTEEILKKQYDLYITLDTKIQLEQIRPMVKNCESFKDFNKLLGDPSNTVKNAIDEQNIIEKVQQCILNIIDQAIKKETHKYIDIMKGN